jgi:hypothetical protein
MGGFKMHNRYFMTSVVITVAVAVVWAPFCVAQTSPRGGSFDPTAVDPNAAVKAAADAAKSASAVTAGNWVPPRTAWGDPDLQGYFLTATYTPLQRPAEVAGKAFYTEEEALAVFKKAVERDAAADTTVVHYDWKEYGMDAWQGGARPNLRTSLITDPPDGRLPPLTAEAQKRAAAAAAARRARDPFLGVQTVESSYTRCIVGLAGPPLVRGGVIGAESAAEAAGVSSEMQLTQTPGYVVVVTQSNSDVRIIPLDGRPHLSANIREWQGDARGRWEGNTLVVETTNFKDRSPATNYQGSTDKLHLIERFTLINPLTIRYEFTVNDPTTWTRPWSAESLLPRIQPPLYEFACHEQNYGLINVVKGAQAEAERAAQKAPGK